MKIFTPFFYLLSFLLTLHSSDSVAIPDKPTQNESVPEFQLVPQFNDAQFKRPTGIYQSANRDWYVTEQAGVIKRIDHESNKVSELLNISEKVKSNHEMGLLGFALENEKQDDSIFYVSYTGHDMVSYISRFHSKNQIAIKKSEEIILKLLQPYENHNGGQIAFGPDGFFYIGFGDGGSAGDPHKNAQNTETLLGAILRIDVNNGSPYSIPNDNPFVNKPGRDEIYAFGLRNPWRWSFDKLTGEFWLGDVGQNKWEEINIIKKGHNYGWNILEANHCYKNLKCDPENFTAPIFEYGRSEGQSVTGGYVYRGKEIPALQGRYVYGDFMSGKIWALSIGKENQPVNTLLLESGKNISSFAQDLSGELYVVDYSGGIYAIKVK